jgi:hypothetical protein
MMYMAEECDATLIFIGGTACDLCSKQNIISFTPLLITFGYSTRSYQPDSEFRDKLKSMRILTAVAYLAAVLMLVLLVSVDGFVVNDISQGRSFHCTVAAKTNNSLETTTSHATASSSLNLPLLRPWTVETQENLEAVLREIVDSTAFFVDATTTISDNNNNNNQWQWSCAVPAFGDDCHIQLRLLSGEPPTALSLSLVDGTSGSSESDDFGWICTKLYECSAQLGKVVDCSASLQDAVVVQHSNCNAASMAWSPQQTADFERILGDNISTWLRRLEADGYVVIDHNDNDNNGGSSFSLATSAAQQDQLSDYYLQETSCQGPTIRTDRVHFLSRAQAVVCGVEPQYDLLVGLANYLNDQQDQAIPVSAYMQPVFPATLEKQLTLPRSLQFAEYGKGDFYIVRTVGSTGLPKL